MFLRWIFSVICVRNFGICSRAVWEEMCGWSLQPEGWHMSREILCISQLSLELPLQSSWLYIPDQTVVRESMTIHFGEQNSSCKYMPTFWCELEFRWISWGEKISVLLLQRKINSLLAWRGNTVGPSRWSMGFWAAWRHRIWAGTAKQGGMERKAW